MFFVEVAKGAVLAFMLAADGLDRGGGEEVLLLEPQGLALPVVVGGVELFGNDLGVGLPLHGLKVFPPVEEVQVHRLGALGLPQPQDIALLGAVAGNLHIPGHRQHGGIAGVLDGVGAVGIPHILYLAAEADLLGLIHVGDEPGGTKFHPVVGQLLLPAVDDLLFEEAQLVADGVAGDGDVQGGGGIQIAGGQPAQTAVAEAGIRLLLKKIGGLEAKGLHRLGQGLDQVQVIGVFPQGTAHEKLHGQVMDPPAVGASDLLGGFDVPLGNDVPDHQGAGLEHLLGGGLGHVPAIVAAELSGDQPGQFLFGVLMQEESLHFGKISKRKGRFILTQRALTVKSEHPGEVHPAAGYGHFARWDEGIFVEKSL